MAFYRSSVLLRKALSSYCSRRAAVFPSYGSLPCDCDSSDHDWRRRSYSSSESDSKDTTISAAGYHLSNGPSYMRGAVFWEPNKPLTFEDFHMPRPKANEVLIKTKADHFLLSLSSISLELQQIRCEEKMDLFKRAKTIRLRSCKDKYLIAEDDQESICQHRDGATNNALWTVEFVQGRDLLRIKSCYGRYLTATNIPFLTGVRGKKVLQTLPSKFDPATEWEPLRDGMQVRL
ncbi:unnamed protein product [Fraxinus pennsylvanica]|uniref:DUF569 domain-containing protein n=1 Tax=Fraxinus pennsylvanica TaxID=56036 RepID=A0AAD1Z0Z9_9LAMI|nr:unnamed protein product [Fraxinus pennsylvanica]